jgi:hypothetical protein
LPIGLWLSYVTNLNAALEQLDAAKSKNDVSQIIALQVNASLLVSV